jgi:vacuolar-type H+-ATPase subunit H
MNVLETVLVAENEADEAIAQAENSAASTIEAARKQQKRGGRDNG